MPGFNLADPAFERARHRADAGAWGEVVALLGAERVAAAERPEPFILLAEALIRSGAPQRARDQLRDAVPVFERTPFRQAHRTALNLLGAASFAVGELDEAQAAWDRVLELAQEAGDALLVARATNNLGAIANLRGSIQDALSLYQLAVPAYQRLGELRGLAETYHNLAMAHRHIGGLSDADEYESRCMELARAARAPRLAAMAQVGRAEVALKRGDYALASATASRAAAAAHTLDDLATYADATRCAGVATMHVGRREDALRLLDDALDAASRAEDALMQSESRLARARLLAVLGDAVRAREDAAEAAATFAMLGAVREQEEALELLRQLGDHSA